MDETNRRQLNFDDLPPRTRTTDPDTSRQAEQKIRSSGKLGKQALYVLGLVRARPGLTTWELADGDGRTERRIGRRLSELEVKGLVRRGPPRTCTVGGNAMTTWCETS